MKVSRKYHIRKRGVGKLKLRRNPQLDLSKADLSVFGGRKRDEIDYVVESLNPFERRMYEQQLRGNHGNREKALNIIVNMVEGDDSQLSERLRLYAKKKGWLEGYDGVSFAGIEPPFGAKVDSTYMENHSFDGIQHHKFYRADVIRANDGYYVFTNWGRVGAMGQTKTLGPYDSRTANTEYVRIINSKRSRGYF